MKSRKSGVKKFISLPVYVQNLWKTPKSQVNAHRLFKLDY
jgi:hypothetical protein